MTDAPGARVQHDARCMLRPLLLTAILAAACNTGGGDDDGVDTDPTACGLAGSPPAAECTGIDGCGAANNVIDPEFCEHCLLRPDTHVCEAGSCRMLGPKGNIQTAFAVPSAAVGSKSYTIATIHPVLADGGKITCEKLMTTCGFLDNPGINTTNSTFKRFSEPARTDSVYPALSSVEAGSGRILFIQVTSDDQGKGEVKARGCVENITVAENETVEVAIELH
jgi:hypothetical protein